MSTLSTDWRGGTVSDQKNNEAIYSCAIVLFPAIAEPIALRFEDRNISFSLLTNTHVQLAKAGEKLRQRS